MEIKINKFILLPLLLTTQLAVAGSYSDYAEVISVEKVYSEVIIKKPYQECYIRETTVRSGGDSATPEIVGGIIGGVIGNKLGKGDGKKILTLAGILLGSSIAHDSDMKNSSTRVVSEEVCETKYQRKSEQRLSHYLVEYSYDGHDFAYKTKSRPIGDSIRVKVNISPMF